MVRSPTTSSRLGVPKGQPESVSQAPAATFSWGQVAPKGCHFCSTCTSHRPERRQQPVPSIRCSAGSYSPNLPLKGRVLSHTSLGTLPTWSLSHPVAWLPTAPHPDLTRQLRWGSDVYGWWCSGPKDPGLFQGLGRGWD